MKGMRVAQPLLGRQRGNQEVIAAVMTSTCLAGRRFAENARFGFRAPGRGRRQRRQWVDGDEVVVLGVEHECEEEEIGCADPAKAFGSGRSEGQTTKSAPYEDI